MPLNYVRHEKVSLKSQLKFCEAWLHERIAEDPAILGLGELSVLAKEKRLVGSGRIDMVLADLENDTRFEVEIMLGATDPSHIVRCIEYYDIERRRYPGYDHVAVLVAEDITSRFLNVVHLLSGTLPLVAIQLNVLRLGDQILLDFVKVLDQRSLPTDDVEAGHEVEIGREKWESRVGKPFLSVCDKVRDLANEVAMSKFDLGYPKSRIRLSEPGAFFNLAVFFPQKAAVPLMLFLNDQDSWINKAGQAGIDAERRKGQRVVFRLQPSDLQKNEPFLREVVQQAVKEAEQTT